MKKNNSGGKRFYEKQPGEAEVKVSVKKSARKFSSEKPGPKSRKGDPKFPGIKGKKSFGDKKADNKTKGKNDIVGNPEKRYKKSGPPDYKKPYGSLQRKDTRRNKPEEADDRRAGKKLPAKKHFSDSSHTRDRTPENYKGRRSSLSKASGNLAKGRLLSESEVRLNRYIANSGLCSRREADVMIAQGLVTLNGKPVTEMGLKVKPGDDVRVDGKRINPEMPVYILLNKPKGYITSTSDPEGRATVMDLIDLQGKERIYPVGRLDRNTTGVLLLTNDGELAQKLMHPSFEIRKIYKARLDRRPSKEHMLDWVNGVELEDGFMSFEQIGFVDDEDPNVVGLEVHSGRNRIVRRMFEHFNYEVLSLDRVMLGEFDHLKLGRGKWRFLSEKEIGYVERLKRMKGKKSGRK